MCEVLVIIRCLLDIVSLLNEGLVKIYWSDDEAVLTKYIAYLNIQATGFRWV